MHALSQRPQQDAVDLKEQKPTGMGHMMGRIRDRMKGWFKEF